MPDFENRYQAPAADLDFGRPVAPVQGVSGSVESAVRGGYDFRIGDVMKEAWSLLPGFKGPVLGACAITALFFIVITGVTGGFAKMGQPPQPGNFPVGPFVARSLLGLLFIPFAAGMIMMGVRRAAGLPLSFTTMFKYLSLTPTFLVAGLLVVVLTYLGMFLLIIPGIYLSVAYGMTMPLIADKRMRAWQAMETSRKALTHRWFKLFGIYFLVSIIVSLSSFLLLIPLIWMLPWSILVYGVLFRRIFGVSSTAELG